MPLGAHTLRMALQQFQQLRWPRQAAPGTQTAHVRGGEPQGVQTLHQARVLLDGEEHLTLGLAKKTGEDPAQSQKNTKCINCLWVLLGKLKSIGCAAPDQLPRALTPRKSNASPQRFQHALPGGHLLNSEWCDNVQPEMENTTLSENFFIGLMPTCWISPPPSGRCLPERPPATERCSANEAATGWPAAGGRPG